MRTGLQLQLMLTLLRTFVRLFLIYFIIQFFNVDCKRKCIRRSYINKKERKIMLRFPCGKTGETKHEDTGKGEK